MSLQSDLARNRAIFEVLTGAAATADPARSLAGTPRAARAELRSAGSAPQRPRLAEESQSRPAQNFSLEYGLKPATGMALSFEAPGDVDYPSPEKPAAKAPADPLESLYYELDARARMSSQLCGEEEF